ncbi:MAG: F0F1 ATP synthase subunit gamma [Candidatus Azobacteroides sp.]|nr:F0F1 ATP synthase subunit gamma [Candidatus Azobacteroides sp.]
MASLKEVKQRISSVESTRKITSAMKLVASAKLRKAQSRVEKFLPYEERLNEILQRFLSSETEFTSAYTEKREVKRVAIVVISSNSSLCGAFNTNVIKLFEREYASYSHLPKENILIYPIGKKVRETILKNGLKIEGNFDSLLDNPEFEEIKSLADKIMNDFLEKKIDEVKLLYTHFKSTAVQQLRELQFLPIDLEKEKAKDENAHAVDYIIEPDKASILSTLLPKSLRSEFFAALLDSLTAEFAARTVAMQIATDNASNLLDELRIQYNKTRQQAITNELLDILSGQAAFKS